MCYVLSIPEEGVESQNCMVTEDFPRHKLIPYSPGYDTSGNMVQAVAGVFSMAKHAASVWSTASMNGAPSM